MGLFGDNQPGSGVRRDEPRKKGIARYFELLTSDIGSLLKLNLMLQLCSLPGQALTGYAVIFGFPKGAWLVLYAVLGAMAAVPVGPAIAAACRCICSLLEYEQGYVIHRFNKVFRHSFRQTVSMGILTGLIMNVYCYFFLGTMRMSVYPDMLMLVAVLLSMAVFFAVSAPFFLQAAYLDLGTLALLKNSLIICLAHLPRCLSCALIYIAGFMLVMILFPISMAYLVLLGYMLPMAGAMLMLWPVVDELFGIGKSLAEKHD